MNRIVLPLVIYIPVGIYLFFFFRRFLTLFGVDRKKGFSTGLSALLALLCVACGWWIYGFGAVLVLHFTAFSLLMEGANLILRKRLHSEKSRKRWSVLYRSGAVSILMLGLILLYGYYNMHQIRETDYVVRTEKKLSKELKIAQISDLHTGTTMDAEKLQEYCDAIQAAGPDVLTLTGDIFDERTTREEMKEAAAVLAGVETTYGVYYVFGNHDYNYYTEPPHYTYEELKNTLTNFGIHVLEDESIAVTEELTIAGRSDYYMNRADIGQVLEGTNQESFILVLDHQPRDFEANAEAGVDLQLSGHTHGGQMWPTGQIGELSGAVELNYGLKKIDSFHAIVSSGIAGWGYAVRTGKHSEYVVVTVSAS